MLAFLKKKSRSHRGEEKEKTCNPFQKNVEERSKIPDPKERNRKLSDKLIETATQKTRNNFVVATLIRSYISRKINFVKKN